MTRVCSERTFEYDDGQTLSEDSARSSPKQHARKAKVKKCLRTDKKAVMGTNFKVSHWTGETRS